MKKFRVALAATFMGLGLMATPAVASIIDLGPIDTSGKDGFVINLATNITAFSDTINFSLADVSTSLTGRIDEITDILGIALDSLNFTLDLFNTAAPTTSLGTFVDPSGTGLNFSYLDLASGDYFFRVAGETGAPMGNGYTYKINVAVNETPIPPALLLFGTALGGLAFAGYRKRQAAVNLTAMPA
jgi:hypothetical protein